MNTRLLSSLLAVALFVGGCATKPVDPLVARRQAYERILKNIEPGMTRRQLYAMLPPKGKPKVMPPVSESPIVISSPDIDGYAFHVEKYMLDRDFYLEVPFVLANPHDYIYREEFNNFYKRIRDPGCTFKQACELLHPKAKYSPLPRSKENLDDEIALSGSAILGGPGCRGPLRIPAFFLREEHLFAPKSSPKP